MIGALSFLPIFLITHITAQCPTPCNLCKEFNVGEMCGPPANRFHCGGRWKLQTPIPHPRCNRMINGEKVNVCLYRREEDNKEFCFCDPGDSKYEQCPQSGESCARDCTKSQENKTCVFWFILEKLYNNKPGRFADGGPDRSVLVYNGKLPGPTITVCQGDDVVLNLINNLRGDPDELGPSGEDPRLPLDSTTFHFHGIRQKQKSSSYVGYSEGGPWSDGVPLVTQCPIPACPSPAPTSTGYIPEPCIFTYKFLGSGAIDDPTYNNAPAGTYWYHSHNGRQRVNGAAGKLIIMPREKNPDIDIDNPDNSLFLQEWYNNATDTLDNSSPNSLLVNGKGKHPGYPDKTDYEVFKIKQPGKRYRFRIIGGIGDDIPIRVSIENHTFTAIASDSIDIVPHKDLDALWISSGERYDIVIETSTINPKSNGAYKINIFHPGNIDDRNDVMLCSLAWLLYPNQNPNKEYEANCTEMKEDSAIKKVLNPVPNNFSHWNNEDHVYPNQFRATVQAEEINKEPLNTQYISLPGITFNNLSMNYPDIPFLFNQKTGEDIKPIRCGAICTMTGCTRPQCNTCTEPNIDCGKPPPTEFPPRENCFCQHVIQQPWNPTVRDWFEIILINGNETAHPIHHHSGWFNIVGMQQFDEELTRQNIIDMDNGCPGAPCLPRNLTLPVFKDTIQVPTNGYVIFRAPIDNAGAWLVHCHINFHNEHGMAMVFQIGKPEDWSIGPNKKAFDKNKNRRCF